MSRNGDNAPVGHTCRMIDSVLSTLASAEGISRQEYNELETILEKIRFHNDSLRTWGNEMFDLVYELEKEVESLNNKVADLTDEITSLNTIENR